MLQQRVCGVLLIAVSIMVILLATRGTTPEETDITVVLFILPLGITMLCTKARITYAAQREAKGHQAPEL